ALLNCIPVVASNVGGLPDLVKHGETGWLVPPRDPPALANAILEALQRRAMAKSMARCGQKLAAEMFDVRRTSAEIASIYGRIVPHRHRCSTLEHTPVTARTV